MGIVARYWLGMAEKMHNDFATAAKTLIAAAEADPKHELAPAMHYQAGDALVRVGDYPAAVRQFDQVLAAGPAAGTSGPSRPPAARSWPWPRLRTTRPSTNSSRPVPQQFPQSTLQSDVDRLWARSLIERKEFARAVTGGAPLARGKLPDSALVERYLLALSYEGLTRYNDAWRRCCR